MATIYTQAQLKAMGKMQDPVTGNMYDLPTPPKTPTPTAPATPTNTTPPAGTYKGGGMSFTTPSAPLTFPAGTGMGINPIGVKAQAPINNVIGNITLPSNQVSTVKPPASQTTAGGTAGTGPSFSTDPNKTLNPNPQNLSPQQIAAGYSNLPGPYSPITGQPNVAETPGTPSPNTGNYTPYTPNTGLYGQIITGAANMSAQPSPQYQAAQAQYLNLQNQMVALQQNMAQQTANIEGSPIDLSLATGQQGILNRLYAGKEAAVAGQMQGAQAAAQTATGQQQVQQQGLLGAGGLAQPQPYPITTTPYNPVTGTYGPMAGGGTAGNAPYTAGTVQGQVGVGQQAAQLQSVQAQAQQLTSQLTTLLDQNPYINPMGLSVVNGLVQLGAAQLGNPAYQTFQNLVNDLVSRYSAILTPAGGNVTDMRLQIANSLINAQASPENIKKVIQALDQQATGVINQMNPANRPGGTTGGGTTSAGGYNYVQNAQGQWVPSQ